MNTGRRRHQVNEAQARSRARKRGEPVALRSPGPVVGARRGERHGTATEYGRHGCRCESCTAAATAHARRFRNPEKHRVAVRKSQRANAALVRSEKERPCSDCGASYPYYVMQFDHLHDKKHTLSSASLRSRSRETIKKEIEKCEVVCANCHAQRTHDRRSRLPVAA